MPELRAGSWAGWLAAALVASAGPASGQGAAAFGPAPRDASGRFLNLAGEIPRAGLGVILPFQFRRIATSIAGGRPGAPERVANDGAFLRENAQQSVPTATWVGHSTLLVQMGGVSFLTDPIWSPTASPISWLGPRRWAPPGLELDALPPIVIGILAILLIVFIIKSLIKFAIIAGAVILLVFILWRTGLLPF